MADPKVQILIEAKNGAKQVLKELAADATAAGKALDTAGTTGAQGLQKADAAADKAAESVENVGEAAQKAEVDMKVLGAAATMIGAGLVYASGKAMEQERQIVGLTRAYGDAADEMLQFAEELDNVTMFSDDDIRAGERYFATLRNNYDLSIEQIQELMRVTAELAAASGTSFEDASSRVTAAIRGEGEAAEYLGLTMNQQSIDRENLTLTMTNQEAAQFRLNALMQQATPYIGTNNDMLQTSAGTVAEWRDRIDDAATSVGNFIGPVGTLATGAATLGFGLTSVVGGMTTLRALPGTITAGFSRMNAAVTGSSRAMSALSLATNPWVIGAAAAVTVGAALWANYREGAEVIATLKDAYLDLQAAANQALISDNPEQAAWLNQLRFQTESVRAEADLIHQKMQDQSQYVWNGVDYSRDEWLELTASYEMTTAEAENLAASQRVLAAALQDSRIDGAALAADMDALYWQFMRGEISADEYRMRMEDLSRRTADYAIVVEDATATQERLNVALADGAVSASDMGLMARVAVLGIEEFANASRRATRDANETGRARRRTIDLILEEAEAHWLLGYAARDAAQLSVNASADHHENYNRMLLAQEAAMIGVTTTTKDMADAHRELEQSRIDDFIAEAVEEVERYAEYIELVTDNLNRLYDVAGMGDPLSRWNLTGHATDASLLAMNINQAATALDDVFRVVVGNTDAIADQANAVLDWATGLIGVEGEYGKIDDLLANGLITQQQWTDAQGAFNSIAQDTASIQGYTLKIQAMQAPLIAEQTAALENQMEIIANLPAEQQLIALGWMDSATAAKAMEFQTLAVAAAQGQLGEGGEQVFASMIAGAARADPVLKALLIDMGLISEGADGTITVHLSGQDQAMSEIEAMTVAMVEWMDLADDGMKNRSVTFEILGLEDPRKDIEAINDQRVLADGSIIEIHADLDLNDPYGLLGTDSDGLKERIGTAGQMLISLVPDTTPLESVFSDGFMDHLGSILVPVEADTAPMDQSLLDVALNRDPIKLPVELDYSALGGSAGGTGNSIGASALGAMQAITIPIEVDTSVVDQALADITTIPDTETTVTIIGNDESAANMIAKYEAMNGVSIAQPVVHAIGNDDSVQGMIAAMGALTGVSIGEPVVYAMGNADSAQNMINAMSAYNGQTLATTYVDVVTRTSTQAFASGGVVRGYAGGGVVELAENGPEMLHFASGGTALVANQGVYGVPFGTYVSPNNAISNSYGGTTVHVHVAGNVVAERDLTHAIARAISAELQGAAEESWM